MSIFKTFKNDETLEQQGILIQYGENSKGLMEAFRIARAGGTNQRFLKAMERATKPYRRQIQTETIDPKVSKRLYMEAFVDTVLLGWENIEGADGAPLDFNRDNAIKLFTDLPDLFLDLSEQAGKQALFRAEVQDADSGN